MNRIISHCLVGLLLAGLFGGCAEIPLGTLLTLSSFSNDSWVDLKPEGLRAAACVDSRVDIHSTEMTLLLMLKKKDGTEETNDLALELISSGPNIGDNIHPASKGQQWFLFGLSPAGKETLQNIQKKMKAANYYSSGGELSFSVFFGKLPDELNRHFPLEVIVRLSPEKPFMTLFKGFQDFSKAKEIP